MFLHTVLTGLQNDNIRSDLQPYLQQMAVSDELLLKKLNIACANETERQNKKKLLTQQRSGTVHSVQHNETPSDKKTKHHNLENPNNKQPDLLNELKELRSDMAILKNLGAEVAQIRESIRQPQPAQTQYLTRSGGMQPPLPVSVPTTKLLVRLNINRDLLHNASTPFQTAHA